MLLASERLYNLYLMSRLTTNNERTDKLWKAYKDADRQEKIDMVYLEETTKQ